jgi:arylsulfatase
VLKVARGPNREADVTLSVDGDEVAEGRIPRLLGMLSSTGMDIGRAIAPVNKDYAPPFAYGGRIDRVIFELPARRSERDKKEEVERETRAAMARQ